MDASMIESAGAALLRVSWQTAVLVLLVLLVQAAFKRQLTARWRYALWLLVVARLLIPVIPASPFSVFNLARRADAPAPAQVSQPAQSAVAPQRGVEGILVEEQAGREQPLPVPASPSIAAPAAPVKDWWASPLLWFALWLGGAFSLGVHVTASSLSFFRRVKRLPRLEDSRLLSLLETSKREMNVSSPVELLEAESLSTPALYGFWRPRLLLPKGLHERFSEQELRFVFLHELAHIRRRDIAMNWLIAVLQIVHWFNPFVWLAFSRMRADRELACDALALGCAGEFENRSYGATIVKLLEEYSSSSVVPSMAGILEDKLQMRRRLQMILRFRRASRWSALAGALVVLLGIVTLTDAQTDSNDGGSFIPIDLRPVLSSTENADWVNAQGSFAAVPRGQTNLAGVPFQCDGLIQLLGQGFKRDGRQFRERIVLPLPADRFTAIHLLGGMAWVDCPPGTTAADVVITYEDGKTARLPVKAFVHMRDWWRMGYEDSPRVTDPQSLVVWRGTHPDVQRFGKSLRLYRTTLENPFPSKEVTKLELVSAMNNPTLFVTGITLDKRPASERSAPGIDLDSIDPPMTGRMKLTFLDAATGLPLEGVQIQSVGSQFRNTTNRLDYQKTIQSYEQGIAMLDYPEPGLDRLELKLSKDGYVPWLTIFEPAKTGQPIPSEHTIRLQPGITIGGKVVDENGTLIENADISLARVWIGGETPDRSNDRMNFTTVKLKTDAGGQWTYGNFPADIFERLRINIEHPDYAKTNLNGKDDVERALRASALTIVLRKGIELHGTVTDAAGSPVTGAKVAIGRIFFANRKETTTDAAGRYRIANIASSQHEEGEPVTVVAEGFAPVVQLIKLEGAPTPMDFQLGPGSVIRGRVLDRDGRPVARVRVVREDSRYNSAQRNISWSTETDSEGRFAWNGSPDEPQEFYIGKSGYAQLRGVRLAPGETEHQITLPPVRKLAGRVLDSATGNPIQKFSIMPAEGDANELHSWSDTQRQTFDSLDGSFEMEINEAGYTIAQVKAAGYKQRNVLLPAVDDGVMRVEAKLEPAPTLEGVVLTAGGQPARNVQVAALSQDRENYLQITRRGVFETYGRPFNGSVTDQDGRFTIDISVEPAAIIALSSEGYGEVSPAELGSAGSITLLPWGRIEGTLHSPFASPESIRLLVGLEPAGVNNIALKFEDFTASADENGRFTFDKVPPGERQIIRFVPTGRPGSYAFSHHELVRVAPGETTTITVGGDGVLVTGALRWSSSNRGFTNITTMYSSTLAVRSPDLKKHRAYAFRVEADGTFKISDVPPGQYFLRVHLSEAEDTESRSPGKFLGSVQQEVEIPDSVQAGTTFDLGQLTVSE